MELKTGHNCPKCGEWVPVTATHACADPDTELFERLRPRIEALIREITKETKP